MATKAILMKMLEEIRGHEQITNRRPTPRPIVLYLMRLRAQNAQNRDHAPRQRMAVAIEWQNGAETPLPVKINHIESGESDLPVVFG